MRHISIQPSAYSERECTLSDSPLGSKFLYHGTAADVHSDIVTTRLQCISTVGKRPLVVREVGSSLSSFLGMLCGALAWVSERALRKEGGAEKSCELHDGKILVGSRVRREVMVVKACTALDQELYIYRLDASMSSLDRDVDRGNETEAWYSSPYPCSTP